MADLTREQAVALFESKFWEDMTDRQRAEFQLNTERLCMPFGVFHESVEKALGRPVFTHEFGLNADGLRKELTGSIRSPTFDEIVSLIPEGKRVLIVRTPAESSSP